jgi:hypothetical protein
MTGEEMDRMFLPNQLVRTRVLEWVDKKRRSKGQQQPSSRTARATAAARAERG